MKKKIFAIALAALLFALSIAGASVAYFTDVESATNVFTAGNVNISLTYGVEGEGRNTFNAGAPDTVEDFRSNNVYPGQEFAVRPVITNVGTEDAYVGAIITLTGVTDIIAVTGDTVSTNIPVAVSKFLAGLDDSEYSIQMVTNGDVITVYVIKTAKLDSTNSTAVLFEKVKIPTEWDNAEMAAFSGFTLDVKAYATQTGGFGDAVTAIKTAFATDWAGYTVQNNG